MTDPFDTPFERFQRTALRYEGRRLYAVDGQEAEQIQAWRDHRPRSERSVRTSEWLRRIAVTTAAGKQWCRVRVVDRPLPEYLRWELSGLVENQAVGDRTLMLDRERAVDMPDFWLFDGGTDLAIAMIMHYTAAGEFQDFELVRERARLDPLETASEQLIARSVTLNEWLATTKRADA